MPLSTMEIAAATQLVTTAVIVGTLIITMRRNGRGDTVADTKLKTELSMEIKGIKAKLDDPENGLGAISGKVGEMQTHCAEITAGCAQRWEWLEKDGERK